MVYLTVTKECVREEHEACKGFENMPEDPEVCGGGMCTCHCHSKELVH